MNIFIKTLKELGFKKMNRSSISYEHGERHEWYAEMLDDRVWITGKGLKEMQSYPGGWVYSDPKELKEDVLKALES